MSIIVYTFSVSFAVFIRADIRPNKIARRKINLAQKTAAQTKLPSESSAMGLSPTDQPAKLGAQEESVALYLDCAPGAYSRRVHICG